MLPKPLNQRAVDGFRGQAFAHVPAGSQFTRGALLRVSHQRADRGRKSLRFVGHHDRGVGQLADTLNAITRRNAGPAVGERFDQLDLQPTACDQWDDDDLGLAKFTPQTFNGADKLDTWDGVAKLAADGPADA